MTDPLLAYHEWQRSPFQDALVRMATGLAIVWWPSGRITTVDYAIPAVIPGWRLAQNRHPQALENLKRTIDINLADSAEHFRTRVHPPGWLIRTRKRRQKARRVRAVAWVHPRTVQFV